MTRTVVDYLKDIREHTQKAQTFVYGIDYTTSRTTCVPGFPMSRGKT